MGAGDSTPEAAMGKSMWAECDAASERPKPIPTAAKTLSLDGSSFSLRPKPFAITMMGFMRVSPQHLNERVESSQSMFGLC